MSRTLSRPAKGESPAVKSKKPSAGRAPSENGEQVRHPIFDELAFPTDPNNLYRQTVGSMLRAADVMGLSHELQIILAQPKNEIMVHFPVRMDDGQFKLFKGYRVQHNN